MTSGGTRRLALLALGIGGALALGLGRVRHPVRRFNRVVLNPLMLRAAGRPGFYASTIRHTGRRTGREYATPVVADPVAGGFLVPLPYGPDTDWCRNVLASGFARITRHGTVTRVGAPAVLEAHEARPLLPPRLALRYRLYRVRRFLRLMEQRR